MPKRGEPDISTELHPALEKSYAAEASMYRAIAREATAGAKITEIELRDAERAEALWNLPRYFFTKVVNQKSVRECMARLDEWDQNNPECDIEVTFTSPGGSCIAGLALWDYLMEFRRRGHYMITHTLGMAASMAGVLLQAGDKRCMGSESVLLIHDIADHENIMGNLGEAEDALTYMRKLQSRIYGILASRSTLSKDEISERAHRRDWWLDAPEALELGFIDQIL